MTGDAADPPERSSYGDATNTEQACAPPVVQLIRPFGAAFTPGLLGEFAAR